MVMHLYRAFSMWIYSNALLQHFVGDFSRLLYGAVHRCTQNGMRDARPQHRELHALLFTNSEQVLMSHSYLRVMRRELWLIVTIQEDLEV